MQQSIPAFEGKPQHLADRPASERPTMVLRVGLLEFQGKSSFCLLRKISANGVQVKLYSPVCEGVEVSLRVGDENLLRGRVAWVHTGLAGIEFEDALDPRTLLRVRQMAPSQRRRASPRVQASDFALLRTGGQEYSAKLCDISSSGAKLLTARSIQHGRTAMLLLPELPALPAFVRWTQGKDTGLVFASPIPIQVITAWLTDRPCVTLT